MANDALVDLPSDDTSGLDHETAADLEHATKLFETFGEHKSDQVVAFVDMLGSPLSPKNTESNLAF